MKAFHSVGITSWKKTHAGRAEGARAAERNRVSEKQVSFFNYLYCYYIYIKAITNYIIKISRAGWGENDAMSVAYLTGLPIKFLRTMAGFEARPGSFYLARATHQPPDALLREVWPWVEEWEERVRLRGEGRNWENGGLDQNAAAAKKFLQLLRYLRVVLLQDLAVLQP